MTIRELKAALAAYSGGDEDAPVLLNVGGCYALVGGLQRVVPPSGLYADRLVVEVRMDRDVLPRS